VRSITVANRTLTRARALADEVCGEAIELSAMPDALAQADILISSTASQLPILGKGAVETALKKRKHRPMFMVDIAVPRDIEPQVAELDDVYLYTVDDLTEVIEENQRSRESAAADAEAIIEAGARDFLGRLRELQAVDTLTALRAQGQAIADAELDKALRQLQRGGDPERLLRQLARGITNKMLHQPTVQLRKASAEGRTEFVGMVQALYQLEDPAERDN
jgi:glutamyl-tRNA reductase